MSACFFTCSYRQFFYLARWISVYVCPVSSHLSSLLGSRFDHTAEAIIPILLNLVPNSAKVIATSGVAAIRLIIRVTKSFHFEEGGCTVQFLVQTQFYSDFGPGFTAVSHVLQHTHYPRLIPIITSNCTSKSVAVRRWYITYLVFFYISVTLRTYKLGKQEYCFSVWMLQQSELCIRHIWMFNQTCCHYTSRCPLWKTDNKQRQAWYIRVSWT